VLVQAGHLGEHLVQAARLQADLLLLLQLAALAWAPAVVAALHSTPPYTARLPAWHEPVYTVLLQHVLLRVCLLGRAGAPMAALKRLQGQTCGDLCCCMCASVASCSTTRQISCLAGSPICVCGRKSLGGLCMQASPCGGACVTKALPPFAQIALPHSPKFVRMT
jgi:hypothetical protein